MANKNLLYTALSRAKKNITLIATEELIKYALTKTYKRNSLMEHMCCYYKNNINKNFVDYYIEL